MSRSLCASRSALSTAGDDPDQNPRGGRIGNCAAVSDLITREVGDRERSGDSRPSRRTRRPVTSLDSYHLSDSQPSRKGGEFPLDHIVGLRFSLISKVGKFQSEILRKVRPVLTSLGKAIAYLQSHWEKLTRFLSIPGAPLDNNWVERALKLFIRQRKNSLFFRTEHSAYLASVITSLIATCLHAGVNALDYLVALQEHRAEVAADPAAWLPWTYATSRASP